MAAALPACYSRREHFTDVLNGTWSAGHALPHASHPACPFLRPWDNCAYDSASRGAAIGSRRYKPAHCALPAFDAAAIHRHFAGRLILFVGDSVQVQLFSAFACMLHAADPSSVLPISYGNMTWRAPETLRKRCHGVQQCHYERACAAFSSGLRVCVCPVIALREQLYTRCLGRGIALRNSDVVFYGSIGIHYTGEMGSNASRIDVAQLARKEASMLLRHARYHAPPRNGRVAARNVSAASEGGGGGDGGGHRRGASSPLVVWREVTAQHFTHAGGHYKQNRSSDDYNRKTVDLRPCTTSHSYEQMHRHQRWNRAALPIVEAASVSILRVWASTALAGDAHVAYGDCTHFCLPGIPNEWARLFAAMLLSHGPSLPPIQPLVSTGRRRSAAARLIVKETMMPRRRSANATLNGRRHLPSNGNESAATSSSRLSADCAPTDADAPPPSWREEDVAGARLVVGMRANITSSADLAMLERALCSLRYYHPTAHIYVIGGADTAARAAELRTRLRGQSRTAFIVCATPPWSFDALGAAAVYASRHAASHFAFMQHSMRLLQPWPLAMLPCPISPYQTGVVWAGSSTRLTLHATWQRLGMRGVTPFGANATLYRLPSHGMLTDRHGLETLLSSRAFRLMHIRSPEQEHHSEMLLAAVAQHAAGQSEPLSCALDGCAYSSGRGPADEAACQRVMAMHRFVPPNLGAVITPPRHHPPCDAASTADDADELTPRMRYVSPPDGIARDLLAALAPGPHGAAIYGAAAIALLDAQPIESRRVLLIVHSHISSKFDATHARMLQSPRTISLPLVRDAAVLLMCNNRKRRTMELLSQLRRYAQRSRWLLHSSLNPGRRIEKKKAGYACGELASLASAQPIWSRYEWAIYSNPDVLATPELLSRLHADFFQPPSGRAAKADMLLDFMKGSWRGKSYAMEYVVFRSASMLLHPLRRHAGGETVWAAALHTCLTMKEPPERILGLMTSEFKLTVPPLRAVRHLTFPKEQDAWYRGQQALGTSNDVIGFAKTLLYPGGVWHNENISQLSRYLDEEEAGWRNVTPVVPSAEVRASARIRIQRGER